MIISYTRRYSEVKLLSCIFFETWFCCVALAILKLEPFLLLPPKVLGLQMCDTMFVCEANYLLESI